MLLRGIYAITSDDLLAQQNYLDRIKQALDAGIALLQYRSKAQTTEVQQQQASRIRSCCEEYGVPLILNDDVALYHAAAAAGVHLGQQDQSVSQAREMLPQAIIGVSCHDSVELAVTAANNGASYVAFGRFFASRSKPQAPPAQLATLAAARSRLELPIVAIGGINPENGASLIAAGADMLAAIDSIFGSENTYDSTRRLVGLFEQQQ
ncbi:MAG: thiamine phosphate synthase [Gammaproteobacteria bacterium]